jgi:hypothetical protein
VKCADTAQQLSHPPLPAPSSTWTTVDGLFKAVCCPGAAVWAITTDDEIVVRLGVTSECPTVRAKKSMWMLPAGSLFVLKPSLLVSCQ